MVDSVHCPSRTFSRHMKIYGLVYKCVLGSNLKKKKKKQTGIIIFQFNKYLLTICDMLGISELLKIILHLADYV